MVFLLKNRVHFKIKSEYLFKATEIKKIMDDQYKKLIFLL